MYHISNLMVPESITNMPVAIRQLPASVGSSSRSTSSSSGLATGSSSNASSSASHPSPGTVLPDAHQYAWYGSNDIKPVCSDISSKQQWVLNLLLTAIEWICLDSAADPEATVALLAMLDRSLPLLYTHDANTGCKVLSAAAAVPLLPSATQLLLPAVLYLMRKTAGTSTKSRRRLLFCLVRFYDALITQGEHAGPA